MLKTLLKKSGYYFTTLVMGKILTAGFFIILARILQPEKFGIITYFITVVQLVSVLTDFGLKSWYQKRMAITGEKILFTNLLSWRVVFFGVGAMLLFLSQLVGEWLNPVMLKAVIIALFLEALISVSDAYYLARGESLKLGYKLIWRNLLLFLVLFFIKNPNDYQLFFFAYNIVLVGVLGFYFPFTALDKSWWRAKNKLPNIKGTLPYATIDGLGIIYGKADGLILSGLRGEGALGIYGAAYRYLDAFNLLPQALFHNLFPLAAKKNGIAKGQVRKMVMVMTGLGVIVAGGVFWGSEILTTGLMGESYGEATEILRYFSLVIILFFFNSPLNTIIQSSDMVKKYLPFLTAVVLFNLGLNFYLISKIGMMGAVEAMILSEMVLVVINIWLIKKIYAGRH
jgi:O-antigen/teichoic acid export membrane protein